MRHCARTSPALALARVRAGIPAFRVACIPFRSTMISRALLCFACFIIAARWSPAATFYGISSRLMVIYFSLPPQHLHPRLQHRIRFPKIARHDLDDRVRAHAVAFQRACRRGVGLPNWRGRR